MTLRVLTLAFLLALCASVFPADYFDRDNMTFSKSTKEYHVGERGWVEIEFETDDWPSLHMWIDWHLFDDKENDIDIVDIWENNSVIKCDGIFYDGDDVHTKYDGVQPLEEELMVSWSIDCKNNYVEPDVKLRVRIYFEFDETGYYEMGYRLSAACKDDFPIDHTDICQTEPRNSSDGDRRTFQDWYVETEEIKVVDPYDPRVHDITIGCDDNGECKATWDSDDAAEFKVWWTGSGNKYTTTEEKYTFNIPYGQNGSFYVEPYDPNGEDGSTVSAPFHFQYGQIVKSLANGFNVSESSIQPVTSTLGGLLPAQMVNGVVQCDLGNYDPKDYCIAIDKAYTSVDGKKLTVVFDTEKPSFGVDAYEFFRDLQYDNCPSYKGYCNGIDRFLLDMMFVSMWNHVMGMGFAKIKYVVTGDPEYAFHYDRHQNWWADNTGSWGLEAGIEVAALVFVGFKAAKKGDDVVEMAGGTRFFYHIDDLDEAAKFHKWRNVGRLAGNTVEFAEKFNIDKASRAKVHPDMLKIFEDPTAVRVVSDRTEKLTDGIRVAEEAGITIGSKQHGDYAEDLVEVLVLSDGRGKFKPWIPDGCSSNRGVRIMKKEVNGNIVDVKFSNDELSAAAKIEGWFEATEVDALFQHIDDNSINAVLVKSGSSGSNKFPADEFISAMESMGNTETVKAIGLKNVLSATSSVSGFYKRLASAADDAPLLEGFDASDVSISAPAVNVSFNNSLSILGNPSNRLNAIYSLKNGGNVTVSVYDIAGKLVKSVKLNEMNKGFHKFSADIAANGTYFVVLQGKNMRLSKKALIIR